MPVAILITSPAHPTLDPAAVRALRDAWGGGAAHWLAPDLAVEFRVPVVPENLWEAWRDMQALGVDLCIVPDTDRRKRLLVADMDSTMIRQECIDELADAAGVGDRVKEVTARAMNGELDFEAALRERVALLEGMSTDIVSHVLEERITEAPGGRTLVATMRAHGAHTLLVSGGFTAFSGPVAARLGFDGHQANELLVQGGRLAGRVAEPVLGRDAKVAALESAAAGLSLGVEDAIALGDGANDLGMLGRAGMGVAMHAKSAVAGQCNLRINHGDLTAALYLQGYSADSFA
jgi:phosphoserine phosphatase